LYSLDAMLDASQAQLPKGSFASLTELRSVLSY